MDNKVPQASIKRRDRETSQRYSKANMHKFGRRDNKREYPKGSRTPSGEHATNRIGVQTCATHEGSDVTETATGESRVK